MVYQVSPYGEATVSVPASEKIAVFSYDEISVYKRVGYPNVPSTLDLDFTSAAGSQTVSSAYSTATTLIVRAGASPVYYEVGADPSITEPTADISAADATFAIDGLAAAQGGYVYITGGTSSTSGNAGGAVKLQGGQPGATGVGGAASVVGAAGGATSGAGGAASLTAGAGTAGNAAGGAAAVTGGAGQGTGAGGAVTVTAGASGAGATGNGGSVTVTGGAAASTNGNGGNIVLAPGLLAGTGATGMVRVGGTAGSAPFAINVTRSTIADAGTITDAQTAGQVLYQDASGGNVTMTTRTGTQLAAYLANMAVGNALPIFCASNHASNTSTIAGGTDVTLVGSGAVTQTGGTFLLVKTNSTTFDLVRVG